jgi:uncharacterized protein (UPF0264 family)
MQLLVSLRDAGEVGAALAGGADILDAKEPARGSLGAVSPPVLEAISRRVPASVSLSVALGDFTCPDQVRRAVRSVALSRRLAPTYVKLGFAGARSQDAATLLSAALEAAEDVPLRPTVVPVAYADAARAAAPDLEHLFHTSVAHGAHAFLLDTWVKDGGNLLHWIGLDRLRALAAAARSAGMLFAVAGSLGADDVPRLVGVSDVVGVRGAACRGGRGGTVDAELVRRLRDALRVAVPFANERTLASAGSPEAGSA